MTRFLPPKLDLTAPTSFSISEGAQQAASSGISLDNHFQNRLDFLNSDAPGAYYFRQSLGDAAGLTVSQNIALTAFLGVVGGSLGYLVSKRGRYSKQGIAMGAGVGIAGAQVYTAKQGSSIAPEDESRVIGADVSVGGASSLVFLDPPLGGGVAAGAPMLMTPSKSLEPPGWLGALVEHGIMTQSLQIKYVDDHKGTQPHISPSLRYAEKIGLGGNMSADALLPTKFGTYCDFNSYNFMKQVHGADGFHYVHRDFGQRFILRYRESPSPVWPEYSVNPSFCHDVPNPGSEPEELPLSDNPWYPLPRFAITNMMWPKDSGMFRSQGQDWWKVASSRYAPVMGGPIVIPKYWRGTEKRRREFSWRLNKYYANGQWLVWAAEMMRLHSGYSSREMMTSMLLDGKGAAVSRPNWWRDHCAMWGVGCAGNNSTIHIAGVAVKRKTLATGNRRLRVGFDRRKMESILKLVMRHTPVPGHKGYLGQQIAPHGYKRQLLDIPIEAGAVLPPTWIPRKSWAKYRYESWREGDKVTPMVLAVHAQFMGSMLNAATLGATAPLVAVGGVLLQRAVVAVLQYGFKMAMGGWKDWGGNPAGAIANLVGTAASVLKDADIDLGDLGVTLPDNILKASSEVQQYYQQVSHMIGIVKAFGWGDYINPAYATLLKDVGMEDALESKYGTNIIG